MLLSAARLRVLKLVDDAEADVYDVTEIADALLSGQAEVWRAALASSPSVFNTSTSFASTAAGVVDLTTPKPSRIINISTLSSGVRAHVRPLRIDQAPTNHSEAVTLSVLHVPDAAFPSTEGGAFVWGNAGIAASTSALLDSAMVLIAALELKPKENEILQGLQKRKDEKMEAIADLGSIPTWAVLPLDSFSNGGRNAPFGYIVTAPHTLQLVTA